MILGTWYLLQTLAAAAVVCVATVPRGLSQRRRSLAALARGTSTYLLTYLPYFGTSSSQSCYFWTTRPQSQSSRTATTAIPGDLLAHTTFLFFLSFCVNDHWFGEPRCNAFKVKETEAIGKLWNAHLMSENASYTCNIIQLAAHA